VLDEPDNVEGGVLEFPTAFRSPLDHFFVYAQAGASTETMRRTPCRHEQETSMPITRQLNPDGMEQYFDKFNKHFLKYESTDAADIEVVSPELGDQIEAEGAHLIGVTYDPKGGTLEVELESGDVRTYHPREVWTVEDEDGFVRAIEIVRDDDSREIVRVRRLGVRRVE
jgi:uncharacterized protein YuzE